MSTESYAKWWIKAKANIERVKGYDEVLGEKPVIRDKTVAGRLVGGLYARYSMVVQEMDACLDQMCQVQKSFTVRKLMDAAATRLNELKDEMCKIDVSEYHYIDGSMIELKLIPHSIEILHPSYMYPRPVDIEDFWKRIKNGETIYIPPPPPPPQEELPAEEQKPVDPMAALFATTQKNVKVQTVEKPHDKEGAGGEEEKIDAVVSVEGASTKETGEEQPQEPTKKEKRKRVRPKGFVIEIEELSAEEIAANKKRELKLAVLILIQTHERARQCRLYYNDLHVEYKMRKAAAVPGAPKKVEPIDYDLLNAAATKIEAYYTGYKARKLVKKKEIERRLLIGMVENSWKSHEEIDKFRRNLEKRRALRDQHIRDYIKANLDEKDRVLRVIGPGLLEDIGDEIRDWFHDWYYQTRNFQEIPPEEAGGTILVMRVETITIEEYLEAQKKKKKKKPTKEEIRKQKQKEAEMKKKEKEKKKKEAAARKLREKQQKRKKDYELQLGATPADAKYKVGHEEYENMWDPINNFDNPLDKPYMDIITEQKCYEMQMEIRAQVDELMRLELELLQQAHEKDKGKKGKAKGKKKKKKKKGKKGKKDPTGKRAVEDLFQELVDNKIIRTYPKAEIEEFRGDFSYQNWETRALLYDPPATLGDVRSAVIMNCIMPLGAETMIKPKSVLIAGPRQSGKHLLANAIFNETRCVLFDLSPPVVAGKYPGKKGNKMLIHLVQKMSRLLQPSIIFVDGAEKPFYKKVPKEEKQFEPKKVGKVLKKIVKPITPDDRVLVLGITGQPWAGSFGALKKLYQRIIVIPPADYGSVFLYWRELLMPYQGIDRNIDISSLALATQRFPLSELKKATKDVLVPRRLIQLSYNPLRQLELLEALLEGPGPINDKEHAKFTKFYKKTPMGKEKAVENAINEKIREKAAKSKKK